jgi:hypothetical protein
MDCIREIRSRIHDMRDRTIPGQRACDVIRPFLE